jgi:hypothetical protein
MKRQIEPELLDELPADDPRAMRSRQDLRRINAWMCNTRIMTRTLRSTAQSHSPRKLVELGAGDGTFLLRIAQKLGDGWNGTEAVLVDRMGIVAPETLREFENSGWRAKVVSADVFDWLKHYEPCDIMIANLFLHHFSDAKLAGLFQQAARNIRAFIGIEPRRWMWSVFFGRLLWMIGCNDVTRHDALISIRAGFAREELSALWPRNGPWILHERAENFSSHLFVALNGSSSSSSSSSS